MAGELVLMLVMSKLFLKLGRAKCNFRSFEHVVSTIMMVYSMFGLMPLLSPRANVGSFATAESMSAVDPCYVVGGPPTLLRKDCSILEAINCIISKAGLYLVAAWNKSTL